MFLAVNRTGIVGGLAVYRINHSKRGKQHCCHHRCQSMSRYVSYDNG